MDIFCTTCGEPWDMDGLHDVIADRGQAELPTKEYEAAYSEVRKDFQRRGCELFDCSHNEDTRGGGRAQASDAIMDLLGDDLDGVASMMEDFDYMGMID